MNQNTALGLLQIAQVLRIATTILNFAGLLLLTWAHAIAAIVVFFLLWVVHRKESQKPAIWKNTPARICVEVLAVIAAVIGFWFFPHLAPIGQTLALVTAGIYLGLILMFLFVRTFAQKIA